MNQKPMSIYIPKVFANTQEEDFKFIFEVWNIGKVKYVDLVKTANGSSQAYVHLDYWYDTLANTELQKKLNSEIPVKKYYIIPKPLEEILQEKAEKEEEEEANADEEYDEDDVYGDDADEGGYDEDSSYPTEEDDSKYSSITDRSFYWILLKNKSKKQIPGERKLTIDLSGLTPAVENQPISVRPCISYVHQDYYTHMMDVNKTYKEKIKMVLYESIHKLYFHPYDEYLCSGIYGDFVFTYDVFLQAYDNAVKNVITNEYNIPLSLDECMCDSFGLINNNVILEIEKENIYLYNKYQEMIHA